MQLSYKQSIKLRQFIEILIVLGIALPILYFFFGAIKTGLNREAYRLQMQCMHDKKLASHNYPCDYYNGEKL